MDIVIGVCRAPERHGLSLLERLTGIQILKKQHLIGVLISLPEARGKSSTASRFLLFLGLY